MSEQELKPCPFCGVNPNTSIEDFCYPTTRDRTDWVAGCVNHKCEALLYGSSHKEAIAKWNTRTTLNN